MINFIRKLFVLAVSGAVLVGIPYMFGAGYILFSWIPAIFVFMYLDEE